jgi:hypothetical protein
MRYWNEPRMPCADSMELSREGMSAGHSLRQEPREAVQDFSFA